MQLLRLVAASLLTLAVIASPTTFSSMSYVANLRVHPFEEMPLPQYSMLDGATVSIEYGFNPGYDQLLLDYTGDFDITSTFNKQTGILYLSGTAPISEYSAAIQSVVFVTSAADGANRVVTFTYGQNTIYATSTEHFYRAVQSSASSWDQAAQDCASRTYMGMQGYLATITSDREMTEVIGQSDFTAWLGAQSTNGLWSWVTGPEGQANNGAGTPFWNGSSLYSGGATATWLSFSQWYRFRPNSPSSAFLSSAPPIAAGASPYFYNSINTDFVEGWMCEFGGMDSAAVTATTWLYTGSMTLQFDCSLFSTTSDCADHSTQGCGWSFGACQTIDCSKYLLQSSCVTNWQCDWYVNGEVGVCSTTECGQYADAPTCRSDPSCKAVNNAGSQQCLVAACSDQSSACSCVAMNGCSWINSQCYSTAYTGCSGLDVLYAIDGTVNMSQAFERFPNGLIGFTQQLMATDFALTGSGAASTASEVTAGMRIGILQYGGASPTVSPNGIGSGGRLTGSKTELQQDIRFHQRAYTASITTRSLYSSFPKAIDMITQSNRNSLLIVVASGALSDSDANIAAMNQRLAQIANVGGVKRTLLGLVLQPTQPITPDSSAAYASLSQLTTKVLNVTMTTLSTQVFQGLCGSTPYTFGPMVSKTGFPQLSGTQPLCQTYPNSTICSARADCSWDLAAAACTQSGCMTYCSKSSCTADPSCSYVDSSNVCLQRCPQAASSAACTVPSLRSVCQWSSSMSRCIDLPCVANPTEDACLADTNTCVYNPNTPTLCMFDSCTSIMSQSTCLANSQCGWAHGNCFLNFCTTTNATLCGLYAQCNWANGTCSMTTCGQLIDEQSCQADRRCAWDITMAPAGCAPALCRNFSTSLQCATNDACYWQPLSENGYQDMCIVKPCSANSRSCDCAAQDGCVWTNNTCKDSTFVQCPAMDVVFLVEATPTMIRPFGRHPDGFSGIIEAIRSWALTVPMSASPLLKGFRLGIVGYGFQQTALQPSASIGGQTLCSNSTLFAGVNMILDNFVAQQPAYSAAVTGEDAILPGLKASIQLFNQSQNSDRKKILMVFGHSAITDGAGSQISSQVAALEGLGVEIFTNVVRRFSVITPSEQNAASFLSPLASDPVQTHYSFSTIDDLQSSILESFCDPSTTIGGALGISRDGTLPCDWLTGSAECGIQGSCYWNSTAFPTCPVAGQCPNLGCVALPAALAAQFECKHCKYSGGSFSCDRSQNYAAPAGVCQKAQCSANCGSNSCSGSCAWDAASLRCQRSMCAQTNAADCNTDLGCVWNGITGVCQLSVCGSTRTSAGCQGIVDSRFIQLCSWNTAVSPAVCTQARCVALYQNRALCASFPTQCTYDTVGDTCAEKLCQYTDAELCSSDSGCYWNPYQRLAGQFGSCNPRQRGCVVSNFSSYSPCTANCGANSVKVRSRAIVQFPAAGGDTCAQAAAAMGTATNPGVMAQSTSCSNTTNWPSDCDSYCSAHDSSVTACINDVSCQWENLRCVPRPVSGCASLATQAACSASDMCSWDTTLLFCKDAPQACRFSTNANCITAPQCVWRTGMNTNALAGSLGLGARLVNPGQAPTYPFSTLSINSQDMFYGASVSIENGYQLGKDVLTMTYPTSVSTTWVPQSGLLQFSGAATAAEYGFVIRAVKFQTSSLASGARNLTWTLGNGTLFSLSTGHYYRYYPQRGITWDNAKFACLATSHYGLSGYLATITATAENSIVATKLGADGWLSGDDGTRSQWQLSTGPESGNLFWIGGSMTAGGYTATGAYANWNNMDGEPKRASSQISHVYLNQSGYWSAKVTNDPTSAGYVCEYGGQATDLPTLSYAIAGGSVIGSSGCLPSTPCIYHGSSDLCNADSQCTWYKSSCVVGCGTYSTVAECNSGSNCVWDTTVLPPVCSENTCASLGVDVCSTQPQCTYQASSGCTLRTGCAQYTAAGSCNAQSSCTWSGTPGECGNRPCSALTVQSSCTNNPLCQWSQVTGCSTILCTYGNQAECSADTSCVWSLPDTTSVEFYGGGQQIAPFANAPILSPTDGNLMTQGVTVMITKGFQVGDDVLSVDSQDNLGNTWIVSWNAATGVLNLRVAPGVQMRAITAFSQMKSIVKFSSASSTQIRRTLSYVLAASTYSSPSTGLLYKALPSVFVNTYTKALQACASSTLLGVSGSLAVILSQQDNLAIRSLGASGFIGATSVDNVWRWSGNASMSFWTGYGSNGQPVAGSFSSWSAGEPMRTNIYAVLNPSGSWKSVPSNNVVNYGVVCQYQPPANQDVASSYNIKPAGCFALPCVGLPMVSCSSDPQCNWVNGGTTAYCAVDTFCSVSTDMSTCVIREQCYWDFVYGSCRSAATSVCSALTSTVTCGLFTQCKWTSAQTMVPRNGSAVGFCRSIGCSTYPNMDSCTGDANCLWNTITNAAGQCVGRVCGYTASGQCWTDPSCQWSPIASTCTKSSCSSLTQGQCTGQCQFDATQGQCVFTRCSDPSRTMCLSDSACLYTMAKGCYMTQCLSYADKDSCQADANCYYSFSDPQQCVASQCLSLENTTSCSANSKTCAWTTNPTGFSYCKELSFLAQFAPSSTPNTCTRQVFDPAWWLWAIMVVDFVLLCAILYRIYLAFSAGMSFFQQVRRTKKYDYSQYAADLFQDAQDYGAENNGVNYARPSLNDL